MTSVSDSLPNVSEPSLRITVSRARITSMLPALLPILLVALFMVATVSAVSSLYRKPIIADLYSSDSLAFVDMLPDLWMHGDLKHWIIPGVLHVFPDLMLFAGIQAFTPSIDLTIVVYGVVQYSLMVGAFMLLYRIAFDRMNYWMLAASALYALLMPLNDFMTIYFSMLHHMGAFINTLYTAVLIMLYLKATTLRAKQMIGVLITILAFVSMVSDYIYIAHAVIPVILTLSVLYLLSQVSAHDVVTLIAVFVATLILSRMAHSLLIASNHLAEYLVFSKDRVLWSLAMFWDAIPLLWRTYPLVVLVITLFPVLSGSLLLVFIKRISTGAQPVPMQARRLFLLVFLLLIVVVTPVTAILSGNYFESGDAEGVLSLWSSSRYLIPLFALPSLWGWLLLFPVPRRLNSAAGRGAAAVVLALVLLPDVASGSLTVPSYRPRYIACLDENASRRNLTSGIAQYWRARQSSVLSQSGLKVVQVKSDLQPFLWNNLWADFARPVEFVIIDHAAPPSYYIDPAFVIERYGLPADSFSCGGLEVLVYNRSSDSAFRDMFSGNPALATLSEPGT